MGNYESENVFHKINIEKNLERVSQIFVKDFRLPNFSFPLTYIRKFGNLENYLWKSITVKTNEYTLPNISSNPSGYSVQKRYIYKVFN